MSTNLLQFKLWQMVTATITLPLWFTLSVSSSLPATRTDNPLPLARLAPSLLAQRQERRIALVIGNSNYGADKQLSNPVNDAEDMQKALTDLGFEVILLKDANKQKTLDALNQLYQQLQQGGTGLFFYAGHGVVVNGENYLIPIGAKIRAEYDVADEAIPLTKVLRAMELANNPLNIVLIDACRNNPYRWWRSEQQRGLIGVNAPTGMFISFSAAPGQVSRDGAGRNSPYTVSVLKYIKEPGLPLPQLFQRVRQSVYEQTQRQQTTWDSSSVTADFAFRTGLPPSLQPTPPVVTPPQGSSRPEPLPSPVPRPSLISRTTRIDYSSLQDLLEAKQWREADLETNNLLLKAAGRARTGWLQGEELDKLPCEDLRIIDQLWYQASSGRFGFRTQSQIYLSLGGSKLYNYETWEKFGDQVGWRRQGTWLRHDQLNWNGIAPRGYLPRLSIDVEIAGCAGGQAAPGYLFSNVANLCNLL